MERAYTMYSTAFQQHPSCTFTTLLVTPSALPRWGPTAPPSLQARLQPVLWSVQAIKAVAQWTVQVDEFPVHASRTTLTPLTHKVQPEQLLVLLHSSISTLMWIVLRTTGLFSPMYHPPPCLHAISQAQRHPTGATCTSVAQVCAIPLVLTQGKGFAPKQHPKQAQGPAKSPPPASRKRKARQQIHTTATTAPRATAGSRPSQLSPTSRHDRLKSIARRQKDSTPPGGAPTSTSGVVVPHSDAQQGGNVLTTQQAASSSTLPTSTLEAHVGGVPHTQLVLSTMQRLSHTLSSAPEASALPQEPAQLSKLAPATAITADAAMVPVTAASAAVAQAPGAQHIEQTSARPYASEAAGPLPTLQPFLAARVSADRTDQDAGCDPLRRQEDLVSTKETANIQLDTVPPNVKQPLQTGEAGIGQAEGQAERQAAGLSCDQAEGQPGYQKAASPDEEASARMPHMQTGSALQQLITRAQKLKEQLDAHAARRHDK